MSLVPPANIGGVTDPRLGEETDAIGKGRHGSVAANIAPGPSATQGRRNSLIYTDSSITFEDYHYWAKVSREYEKTIETANVGIQGIFKLVIGAGQHNKQQPVHVGVEGPGSGSDKNGIEMSEKAQEAGGVTSENPMPRAPANGDAYGITTNEWDQAQRAARTATWGSIFYLITTDILGPYNVPWAIGQMGYGPGVALYTVFGAMAWYSGVLLWQQFTGLDSTRYPMRNYGDLAFRVFGNWARVIVNVLQSFQFFLNVALIIESSGQSLAQMAAGQSNRTNVLCFVVAEVIFTIIGFILGQIRTLQRLSWLANLAIWLNVLVIIVTMVVTSKFGPNYDAVYTSYKIPPGQPIVAAAYWPADTGVMDHVNGLMNCVFAYGGATLFNELMAEMRRPMDFWKALLYADIFIYFVYLCMGLVVYTYQGQYVYNPAYQGIPNSAYAWQTLGNAISFISALIAALLYGNIGIKVFYAAVLRDVFRFPSLNQKTGKLAWVAIVPIYWALAFVIAAAIPQVANLTAFVGAACILQFTYTFPPILKVAYNCQADAILPEEDYDPITGQVQRRDHGFARWMRGYRKKLLWNTFDVVFFLASAATAGLGIWSSVVGMHQTFAETKITPFSCQNPAG